MTTAEVDHDGPLLRRVAAGDEVAFRRLYDRHVGASRHRALRVLAAPELVDDVVQLVFLDVWTFAGRFDGERGTVRGWVLQLTHHKAVDAVRAQERHLARHAREQLLHVEPTSVSPHEVAVAVLDRERLTRAMTQLPPRQREALGLCFLAQLSQLEAAEALGVPVGTVKSRTHTGLLRLRLLLGAASPPATVPSLLVEATA